MRRFALVFALATLVALVATVQLSGCAETGSYIRAASSVIDLIAGKTADIERHVSAAADDGLLPADVAARAKAVREALDAINAEAAHGPAAYDAAVARFQPIWEALVQVARPYGVSAVGDPGLLGATGDGGLRVETSDTWAAKLHEAGPE